MTEERDAFAGSAGFVPTRHEPPLQVVHLVAKTHLDLGFTALAAEVADQYVHDFFPRAIRVAAELRARGGPERLVWTTGAWPLWHALEVSDAAGRRAIEDAIAGGDLAWHALPLTTHTELMSRELFEVGLGISAELDARFGRQTTAGKLTDVPGHTIGMVPSLAHAGITLLHIGVNPAWPVPDVPPVFRWQTTTDDDASAAQVTVVYQAGGYGGFSAVPGCAEALAFLHTGDNLGPPSVEAVLEAHADLRAKLPDVEIRASTLDAFARALVASGAEADLPVVTSEIGDGWIFGAATDPQKLTAFGVAEQFALEAMRGLVGTSAEHDAVLAARELLLVPEHTWGLDLKTWLPDETHWERADLAALRTTPEAQHLEASWAEQRAYVDDALTAIQALPDPHHAPWAKRRTTVDAMCRPYRPTLHDQNAGRPGSWNADPVIRRLEPGEVITTDDWTIGVDPATGSVDRLVWHGLEDRTLAEADHRLAELRYQTFSADDYEHFYAQLVPVAADEWWARWDNTKPGLERTGAPSGWWRPELVEAWHRSTPPQRLGPEAATPTASHHEIHVRSRFVGEAEGRFGAPPELWTSVSWIEGRRNLVIRVQWFGKPASRFPEATWCSFRPKVTEPESWEISKLGHLISPLDVVRHGGRSLHGCDGTLAYGGADGPFRLQVPSPSLVAPGCPNLLDADPPPPDLAGGMHVLLHDNCWGTNFPMWNEGDARFAFTLSLPPP